MELTISIIQNKIYEVRGVKVMLDFDLAEMYGAETSQLKRQVRRNIDRFPDDFMFELTAAEFKNLRCQNGASSWGGTRYLPFAFTVHGVVMLSNVLKSKRAVDTSILIVRAFNAMREVLLNPHVQACEVKELQNEVRQLQQYIEHVFADYNDINEDTRMQLENICEVLAELQAGNKLLNKPRNPIGFIMPQKDNND
jgi:phage regulator Rha-like protein